MKTLTGIMAAICLLGIYAAVDLLDRHTEERIAYQRWVNESCLPTRAGDRAVIISNGQQMHCRIYSRDARGMTPVIVSAAVMEAPL
jgi:hypothetical protein